MCQDGYTPCYVASSHVQLDCLKVLIEANAGVNKANTVSVWWKTPEKDYTITGLPLTWKTGKPGKVREFQWDFSKSGNLPKKSENLRQNSKRQGKVREFCCLKFIFSQVEEPNFKNCQGEHAPRPPKWSQTYGRALLWSSEKSGKRQGISDCLESGNPAINICVSQL